MVDDTDMTNPVDAPYGLKADGTPYQRRPRNPEASARAAATRRARANGTEDPITDTNAMIRRDIARQAQPPNTDTDWVTQLETLATRLETAAARVRDALDAIR